MDSGEAAARRQQLRREILARRDNIPAADRGRKSRMVEDNLWQLVEIIEAGTLFVYASFRSEVETLGLIRRLLASGKKVAVPLTDVNNARLHPVCINDPDRDLAAGYCGIPEPKAADLNVLDPRTIDTVILPGSVFDPQGGRLGYGSGYYDRFLAFDAPTAHRIGLAFEEQVVRWIPLQPHDKRLHVLVTEERIIRTAYLP
jgi:5-formyltetrahydrofolate cyclo-ligase